MGRFLKFIIPFLLLVLGSDLIATTCKTLLWEKKRDEFQKQLADYKPTPKAPNEVAGAINQMLKTVKTTENFISAVRFLTWQLKNSPSMEVEIKTKENNGAPAHPLFPNTTTTFIPRQGGWIATSLSFINLAEPLIRLKTPPSKELRRALAELKEAFLLHPKDPTDSKRDFFQKETVKTYQLGVENYFRVLDLLFTPEKLPQVIDSLIKYKTFLSKSYIDQFIFRDKAESFEINAMFLSVIGQFPPSQIEALRKPLLERFYRIKIDETKVRTSMEEWDKNVEKRNIEFMLHIFNAAHIEGLKSQLKENPHISADVLSAIMDRFYQESYQAKEFEVDHPRGDYSFRKVIELAKQIQKSPLAAQLTEGNYVQIFGSFPNGKAGKNHSDIDIQLSPALASKVAELVREYLSSPFGAMIAAEMELLMVLKWIKKPSAVEFMSLWTKTERQLASVLGRPLDSFKETELMTLGPNIPPSMRKKHIPFGLTTFGPYNPLVVKISAEKIHLQYYETVRGWETIEVEIHD